MCHLFANMTESFFGIFWHFFFKRVLQGLFEVSSKVSLAFSSQVS